MQNTAGELSVRPWRTLSRDPINTKPVATNDGTRKSLIRTSTNTMCTATGSICGSCAPWCSLMCSLICFASTSRISSYVGIMRLLESMIVG